MDLLRPYGYCEAVDYLNNPNGCLGKRQRFCFKSFRQSKNRADSSYVNNSLCRQHSYLLGDRQFFDAPHKVKDQSQPTRQQKRSKYSRKSKGQVPDDQETFWKEK